MRYRFQTTITLACVLALSALAASRGAAWQDKGHQIVNGAAIDALPSPLKGFYQQHRGYVVEHSVDPDIDKRKDRERKLRGEPLEGPRHFIDLDRYGPPPFQSLPEQYEAAVARFGKSAVDQNGTVPWRIEEVYNDLVAAFKQKDGEAILRQSAWLGHYVGDAHVPFHATENYDGQLTGQPKLHAYFEASLLTRVDPAEIHPAPARRITRPPHELAFEWLRESYADVKPLLEADAAHGGTKGPESRDLAGFAKTAKPIAVDRLTKAASRLASLWYSAWIEGGRPSSSSLRVTRVNESSALERTIRACGCGGIDDRLALQISENARSVAAAGKRR
jgi:hypothetical protein